MDERVGQFKDAEDQIGLRYRNLSPVLDERRLRLWLGAEAMAIGPGGIAVVARATKQRRARIAAGLRELSEQGRAELGRAKGHARDREATLGVRRPGGGRKRVKDIDPTLVRDLDSLISPGMEAGAARPLRWTSKSLRRLAAELAELGHSVSPTTLAEILHGMGFSVRANTATEERSQHPDRDSQFGHINERSIWFLERGLPVVSVDTEKKTLVADANADAPDGAWVKVPADSLTPQFAAAAITTWWTSMGDEAYPGARSLLLIVDSGGRSGFRALVWRRELQRLADATGLVVEVCHLPLGTRKWSRVEYTVVSTIFRSSPGAPRVSDATLLHLIGLTGPPSGEAARRDEQPHGAPLGLGPARPPRSLDEPGAEELSDDWNYIIEPRT